MQSDQPYDDLYDTEDVCENIEQGDKRNETTERTPSRCCISHYVIPLHTALLQMMKNCFKVFDSLWTAYKDYAVENGDTMEHTGKGLQPLYRQLLTEQLATL